MISALELLRVLSSASLISWVCVGTLVIPWLIEAHPKRHPIGLLIVVIVGIEIVRSISQVSAAFHTAELTVGNMAIGTILFLRGCSIVESVILLGVLWRIRRSDP